MNDLSNLGLPQSVIDLVEFSPVEDVALAVLREDLYDVPVVSLIENDAPPMFVLVRRLQSLGYWKGDPRFVDSARIVMHVYTSDPDGDEKGALISEAVRVCLTRAAEEKRHVEGHGWVSKVKMITEPTRKTDWATSTGPVQFADLPLGMYRYESVYDIDIRKSF